MPPPTLAVICSSRTSVAPFLPRSTPSFGPGSPVSRFIRLFQPLQPPNPACGILYPSPYLALPRLPPFSPPPSTPRRRPQFRHSSVVISHGWPFATGTRFFLSPTHPGFSRVGAPRLRMALPASPSAALTLGVLSGFATQVGHVGGAMGHQPSRPSTSFAG